MNGPLGKLYLSGPKRNGKSHKARQKLAPLDAANMSASQDAEGLPQQSSSSPSNGSPSHINTVRSLGLLHELQDYINSVESLTNEQKQELLRLREEKKAMERMARHHGKASNGTLNLGGDIFRQSQLQELPPRLRAVLEDNKAMKEKLKSYKNRMLAAEHLTNQKNSQIIVMENAIASLKQQLAACSRTPAQVESEENLKSMLYSSGRAVKNLEYEVNVLKQKVDTDAKLHRQAMAASRREQSALERKIILLNATVAEKDIEIRKAHLEIKQLSRRLAPKRGQPLNMVSASLDELEAQEQMHMQMMMEGSYQQESFYPDSGHMEQQEQQQHDYEQHHEQAEHQPQQAHEEEGPLATELSLGISMSPSEQQHPGSQLPPEQQEQADQQQDQPQGTGELHGEEQGAVPAASAEGSAALEAEAAALEVEVPQSPSDQVEAAEQPHAETEGVSEAHEAEEAGAEGAPQDVAEPSSLTTAEAEPEEAAPPPPPPASSSVPPEGEQNQEGKQAGASGAKQGVKPEGTQHSAAPKAVPYRHTAARAAGRGPGQKKEPSPPASVPPKASLGAKAARGSSSMRAKEAGPDQPPTEATPPAPTEPAGPGQEQTHGVPAAEPAAAEVKPTESETGGAVPSAAAEDTPPAASSSEAQPQAADAAQPAADSGEASAMASFAQSAPPGEEGGDASHAAGKPAAEPEKAGEAPAEPAAAEPAAPAATELAAPAAGAIEAEQTGAAAAAAESAVEPAAAAPQVEPAGATDVPAEQTATGAGPAVATETAAHPTTGAPDGPADVQSIAGTG